MTRYAIYFVPQADSALWCFGCGAIGYDSHARRAVPFHDHAFFAQGEIQDWTADPRRYGFHATLKPPFALADGTTLDELERTAAAFTRSRQAFDIRQLKVAAIGNFLALVPTESNEDLNQLAAECVRAFEPFRAPLSAADRERRLKSPLSPKQITNLDQWGYPYVFDEFRFHMTLTGRLPEEAKTQALPALQELYSPIDGPVRFDGIAICEQPDRNSQFFVRQRLRFGA